MSQAPYPYQPQYPLSHETYQVHQGFIGAQARHIFENYFILALVFAITIMMVMYRRNPPFMQEETTETWLEGKPDKKKLLLLGIVVFTFVSLGPLLSEMLLETHMLYKMMVG
jgi:hypothetical protein